MYTQILRSYFCIQRHSDEESNLSVSVLGFPEVSVAATKKGHFQFACAVWWFWLPVLHLNFTSYGFPRSWWKGWVISIIPFGLLLASLGQRKGFPLWSRNHYFGSWWLSHFASYCELKWFRYSYLCYTWREWSWASWSKLVKVSMVLLEILMVLPVDMDLGILGRCLTVHSWSFSILDILVFLPPLLGYSDQTHSILFKDNAMIFILCLLLIFLCLQLLPRFRCCGI